MPDKASYEMHDDPMRPLQLLPRGQRTTMPHVWVPRIELVCGRDVSSAGISVVGYGLSEHGGIQPELLLSKRWQTSPQTAQECLQTTLLALGWLLKQSQQSSD